MFRNIPVFEHSPHNLAALAQTMIAPLNSSDREPVNLPAPLTTEENPLIPAGYTYFGQFVTHDITFDPASSLQRQNDPDSLYDFRTPRFDLDSLYGRGPTDQPYLYRNASLPDPHPDLNFDRRGVMLLAGNPSGTPDKTELAPFPGPDLLRNSEEQAIIGDPRNDENLIISQLQVLFIQFHNRMVERVFQETGRTGDDLLKNAQRQVRWHYQWIVVHDFLARLIDGDPGNGSKSSSGIVADILKLDSYPLSAGGTGKRLRTNFHFYHWHDDPFMPIEFSAAVGRFGHSMVRSSYFINDFVRQETKGVRIPIFSASMDPRANLKGLRKLPENWAIQWKYFFELDAAFPPQRGYKLDTFLAAPLSAIPERPDMPNLAQRNLVRGLQFSLPSGQNVARAMGVQPLSDGDLELSRRGAPDFEGDAPLWFYILREAELLGKGQRLGPMGGRIVAEVLLGLLVGDPFSWPNVQPDWQPPLAKDGRFGMPELIRFTLDENAASSSGLSSSALARWRRTFSN
jgi:hypothetical protein